MQPQEISRRQKSCRNKRSGKLWGTKKMVVFLRRANVIFNNHVCETLPSQVWITEKIAKKNFGDMFFRMLIAKTKTHNKK
jgi:hypothetical protein